MVDVTFPFIILLGGLLVGLVTARVRRHCGWRRALDILVAAICGPIATTLWMRVVPHLFPQSADQPYLSRGWASLLADVLWFSPVIGGFVGVAAVAVGFRLAGHGPMRPQESWGEKIGDAIRIVGWVYTVIALALIVGVVILAFAFNSTGVLTPSLFVDLLIGAVIILFGWLIARLFGTSATQPAAPPPS